MQIFIKTLNGKTLTLNVNAEDTISELKSEIQSRTGIPPPSQRLLHSTESQMVVDLKRTLASYNITEGNVLHLVLRLRGVPNRDAFIATDNKDSVSNFLSLTDAERKNADIPYKALNTLLKKYMGSKTKGFIYEETPGILDANQAKILCEFAEYIWQNSRAKVDDVDMIFGIQPKQILRIFKKLDKRSSSKGTEMLQKLSDAFDRIDEKTTEREIFLRITKGPTNSAVKFHTGDMYATTTVNVALNSTDEYEGGRTCFYVFENLEILNKRPVGSVLIYPKDILRGITSLHKGTMISLLMVGRERYMNQRMVQKHEVNEYLKKVKKSSKKGNTFQYFFSKKKA